MLTAATGAAGSGLVNRTQPATDPGAELHTRTVPRSGQQLPAVGLGTFMTFDRGPDASRDGLRSVFDRFWDSGGRVVDTSPLYGRSEANVGEFASGKGVTEQMFIANKTWATGEWLGDFGHARRQLEQTTERLRRPAIDLLQVHSLVAVETNVPILKHFRRDGLIRYVGVTHHDPLYFPALEHWIRNGDIDFVQLHYSIQFRLAEERLLPLAADHGTAVLLNMPLEKARLHRIVEGHPLPGLAAEIGCENWSQFFLKYVISHPAVTCALPATTNPDHLAENVGAMSGPLPDDAMRRRMVAHMETIPGFADLQNMPWYPGKTWNHGGLVTMPPVPAP
jgi:aryl-alcohol dehydrogenase-like predicted oxidoreductase